MLFVRPDTTETTRVLECCFAIVVYNVASFWKIVSVVVYLASAARLPCVCVLICIRFATLGNKANECTQQKEEGKHNNCARNACSRARVGETVSFGNVICSPGSSVSLKGSTRTCVVVCVCVYCMMYDVVYAIYRELQTTIQYVWCP